MNKYNPIFITATNTDIGKTYTTIKLIKELGKRGLHVGVFKPIETGVEDFPADGKLLLEAAKLTNPNLKSFTCEDIVPIQYRLPAAPIVSKQDAVIDFKALHLAYKKIENISDIVLIEGAGGLMVPIEKDFYMYDFAKEFNAKVLLVTHSNLGCINDALLNIRLLESLNLDYVWCVNIKGNEKEYNKTTLPFYKEKFGKVLSVQHNIEEITKKLICRSDI